ncbi:MAG: VOC family protein [Candidatus Bathyarchaeota archaeon]
MGKPLICIHFGIFMIGFEHIGFTVTDLDTSVAFYTRLGFRLLRKTNMPHALMYLGDAVIELTQGPPSQGFHLALSTDNIVTDVALLQENGIETTQIQDNQTPLIKEKKQKITEYADPTPTDPKLYDCMMPNTGWKRATLKDPDGVHIEIWQRKAGSETKVSP